MSKNREKDRKRLRTWRKNNPEKRRAQKRRYYHRHKEKEKARQLQYRTKNRARLSARARTYYHSHRDEVLARGARLRREHPEIVRARARAHRLNNRGAHLLYGIRKTSKRKGLAFDLTRPWIDERLAKGVCEMSGLPFDMIGKRTPNSPSVDRRNPKGGYTVKNCRVVLWFLNKAISNLGEDYALMVFEKVLARRTAGA